MATLKEIFGRDIQVLVTDVTKHLVYTFFLILFSSGVTYLLLSPLVKQKIENASTLLKTNPSTNTVTKMVVEVPPTTDDSYTERGSPYDNRTVNGATPSANVIFHGSRDKKQIALTFDAEMTDGMKANVLSGKVSGSYDKRIIDILNQTQTKATLFLTGMWIELYPDVTRELSQNPLFELGSHSYSDTSYHGFCYGLYQIPKTLAIEEIGATEKLLRERAGIDNRLFRFPGGCYTPEDVALVNQANDTVVHWDVVGADGFNTNATQVEHNVIDNVQNGSIIVLHMNGAPTAPKTADALPAIISALKAKGFEFVKINELLGFSPEPRVTN